MEAENEKRSGSRVERMRKTSEWTGENAKKRTVLAIPNASDVPDLLV